jgi:microcin C transport system permease protein
MTIAAVQFLGMRITPLTARRIRNFAASRRGVWSLWIFLALLLFTMPAEFIANDKPLLVRHGGQLFFPVLKQYPETAFGGDFETEADYKDPYVIELIKKDGWIVWPLIPFSYETVVTNLPGAAPSPPTTQNWLGTDDQARDVTARIIYGFRISVLFGLILTAIATVIGVAAGAVQGYFGGWVDLLFQRFLEIWSSMPALYVLIILASVITPSFWWLLGIMVLFYWTWPIGLVRAEFLRARNFEYVRAARALGVGNITIMFRHLVPNATVSTLTFLPFTLAGSLTALASLDFLGLGLPPGSPSLGDLVLQGKNNLQAPWLGFTGFIVTGSMLILLIFIGESVRDAFDPRKTFAQQ